MILTVGLFDWRVAATAATLLTAGALGGCGLSAWLDLMDLHDAKRRGDLTDADTHATLAPGRAYSPTDDGNDYSDLEAF